MKKTNIKKLLVIVLLFVLVIFVFQEKGYFDKFSSYAYPTTTISEDNVVVSFIDVGQADAILIQTNTNNILIDAGNNADGEKLVSYFKSLGITKFNKVFATHAHEDHIGGMDDIINNFDIDSFYMPDVVTTTKTFEDMLDALDRKNMKFTVPEIDANFNFDDVILNIVYIGNDNGNLNDSSIIIKMIHGSNSFLFTGDATSSVEEKIIDKDIKATVLKVGHHGSKYSTTIDFLEKVNPLYAVISVGDNNSYGHPTIETLERLNNLNIKIYRTDMDFTIIMESDGEEIFVNTIKTDTNGG